MCDAQTTGAEYPSGQASTAKVRNPHDRKETISAETDSESFRSDPTRLSNPG